MKRFKRVNILLGVLALLGIVTLVITNVETKKETIRNSEDVILQISYDSVTTLSWKYDGNSFSFHKDDTWLYDTDTTFPVDEDTIKSMLSLFESFGVSFAIEDVEDYSQYGLQNPICTINVGTSEETYQLKLGDYSTMDSQRYVSIGDGNVYLVSSDPLDFFDVQLKDLLLNDAIPAMEQVTKIQFSGSENYTVVYEPDSERTVCADDTYFTSNGKALDSERVNSYLSNLQYMSLTDYMTYSASDGDLSTYGMDSPELNIAVTYETEETEASVILHLSRDPSESKDSDTVTVYARVDDSPIIYQIDQTYYEALMQASYNDLRHHEIITAELTDITQFDFTLDGSTCSILTKEEDGVWSCYYEDKNVVASDLSGAITSLSVSEFTSVSPTEKEEIHFIAYLDNETFPQIEVAFYRHNGESCLAVVDGETLGLVSRSSVVDLIEAVNSIILG